MLSVPSDPPRILVVDDEEDILQSITSVLIPDGDHAERRTMLADLEAQLFGAADEDDPGEAFHCNLTMCRQGKDAIAAVRSAIEADAPYEVAFLDVRMPPGIDGVEAAERIRAIDPHIMIVFMTGFSDVHPRDIGRRVPPADKYLYCQKPLQRMEIEQLARTLTARWRVERAHRLTRERLDHLLASSPAMIYSRKPGEKYATTFVSENVKRSLGYTATEVLEDPTFWCTHIHPHDQPRVLSELENLSHADYRTTEYRFRHRDGTYRWLRDGLKVIRSDDRTPKELVGYWVDITEQRETERALHAAKEEAESATAANEAKSRFLARMSHEIRTPMHGVLGMADILGRTDLDTRQRDLVTTIRRSGQTLLSVINDILDFSKIEAGKLELAAEPFDLRASVQGVVDLLSKAAREKSLGISLHCSEDIPDMVRGDSIRLRQILVNLVGNAIKFTKLGDIAVDVSPVERTANKALVRFAVSDTGIGIPRERYDEVFEPFEQINGSSSRQFGGTGLGLAIVRDLVRMMGGEVTLESEVGRGSRFSFAIAFGMEADRAAQTPPQPSDCREFAPGTLSARVLLVEDNPVNRAIAETCLRNFGCDIEIAENGVAAIAAWERSRFDIILMDCEMPKVDGYEATRRIRQSETQDGAGNRTPIVAVTAHALEEERQRCFAVGMDDFLAKPYSAEDMFLMLERWLDARDVRAAGQ